MNTPTRPILVRALIAFAYVISDIILVLLAAILTSFSLMIDAVGYVLRIAVPVIITIGAIAGSLYVIWLLAGSPVLVGVQ